ncbi:hypothetical protein ANDA3_2023 [plant metagenome]|uniref:Uncharacterized protein n=1 Tax=plant metagenome TaxID=1297885 RepID=A0A484PDJ7_9ZZZZ
MDIVSTKIADARGGVALESTVEGHVISTYVVISEADLNALAEIVPAEQFESDAQIHAAAVNNVDQAYDQVGEVLENMDPGDVAVFLCSEVETYDAALDVLGYDGDRTPASLN